MANYTKQQVADIIKNAPAGSNPKDILKGLVERGHILEGYNDQTQSEALTPTQQSLADTLSKQRGGSVAGVAVAEQGFKPPEPLKMPAFVNNMLPPAKQEEFKQAGGVVEPKVLDKIQGVTSTMSQEQAEQTKTEFKKEITEPFKESFKEEIKNAAARVNEIEKSVETGEISRISGNVRGATDAMKSFFRVAYSPFNPIVESAFEQEDVQKGLSAIDAKLKEKGGEIYDGMIQGGMTEEQAMEKLNNIESSVKGAFSELKGIYDNASPETKNVLKSALNVGEAALYMYGSGKAKEGITRIEGLAKEGAETVGKASQALVPYAEKGLALANQGLKTGGALVSSGVEGVGKGLVGAGLALEGKASKQELERALKMLTPKMSAKEKATYLKSAAKGGRIEGGQVGKSAYELEMGQEVAKIKGLTGKGLKNDLNKIAKTQKSIANKLEQNLKSVVIDEEKALSVVNAVKSQVMDSATKEAITAEAERLIPRFLNEIERLVKVKPLQTADDLWKLRIDFDNYVKRASKDLPKKGSPQREALDLTRRTLNDYITEVAPDLPTKQLFRKWSLLEDALDIVSEKSVSEASGVLGKVWQSINNTSVLRTDFGRDVTTLLGGLGLASLGGGAGAVAGAVAIPSFLGYKGLKAMTSPEMKRFLAKWLTKLEKVKPEQAKTLKKEIEKVLKDESQKLLPKGEETKLLKSPKSAKYLRKNSPNSVSGKQISIDEANKIIRQYFTPDEVSLTFAERIALPDGQDAFGMYKDAGIMMVKTPDAYTPDHEAFHAFAELFAKPKDFRAVLDETKATQKLKRKTDLDAEEWLAEEFSKYAVGQRNANWSTKLKDFFSTLWNDMKSVFGKEDKVKKMYDDLISGERPAQNKPLKSNAKYKIDDSLAKQADEIVAKAKTEKEAIDEFVKVQREDVDTWATKNEFNAKGEREYDYHTLVLAYGDIFEKGMASKYWRDYPVFEKIKTRSQLEQIIKDKWKAKGGTSLEQEARIPKTIRVWVKSKFSDNGAYTDYPIIRKEENITLYQGSGIGEKRQFWTKNKKYAEQFGDVKEKTGTFYQINNGNRVIDVYVEAPTSGSKQAK